MAKTLLKFLVLTALLVSLPLRAAHGKTTVVAVIDTGVDSSLPHLCKFGHKSFALHRSNPLEDEGGHGTHISGIIIANAGDADFCIVSIKYYDPNVAGNINLKAMIDSLQYAINIHADFINISGGGPVSDAHEHGLITQALDRGMIVVVAAGNDHDDLDKSCDFFPACYDTRLIVVGNLKGMERSETSNYGEVVSRWEVGTDVESTLPGNKTGKMSGTSQATAAVTGKILRELQHR